MNIPVEELKYKSEFWDTYGKYIDGYRIVYFYSDNKYKISSFCGSIEGFMMEFIENDPIEDESDIPPFVSIDDILDRCLQRHINDIIGVAIYKTDGTLVERKDRD